MITLGSRVFFISESEDVVEYKEGETPLWVPLPDTKCPYQLNVFDTMDYDELLI